jgi:hypothetical protein
MTLRKADLGKFEGGLYIDQYAFDITLDGVDDEIGDVSEQGIWYGKIYRGTETVYSLIKKRMDDDEDKMTPEEEEYLADVIGIIVSEDDQGFVNVDYYESDEDLKKDWDKIVDDMSEDDEEEST